MNYIGSIYYYYGIFPFISSLLLILFLISEHKKIQLNEKLMKLKGLSKNTCSLLVMT